MFTSTREKVLASCGAGLATVLVTLVGYQSVSQTAQVSLDVQSLQIQPSKDVVVSSGEKQVFSVEANYGTMSMPIKTDWSLIKGSQFGSLKNCANKKKCNFVAADDGEGTVTIRAEAEGKSTEVDFTVEELLRNPFKDDIPDWAYEAVIKLNRMGIIKGYDNGKFGSGDPVTTGQVVTLLYRLMEYLGLIQTPVGCQQYFGDVAADHYAYTPACAFAQNGWATGNVLGADRPSPRGETAGYVQRVFGDAITKAMGSSPHAGQVFDDIPTNHPHYNDTLFTNHAGIMTGYPNGEFGVEDPINRAAVAVIMYRTLLLLQELGIADIGGGGHGSSTVYAACIVHVSNAGSPKADVPEIGRGYAMHKIYEKHSITSVRNYCTDGLYKELMDDYCKDNKERVQWGVLLYDEQGNIKTGGGAASGSNYHECPDTGGSVCSDTDGGKIYEKAGAAGYIENGKRKEFKDYCHMGRLFEYYCGTDGAGDVDHVIVDCPAGSKCEAGACVSGPADPCDGVVCMTGTKCEEGKCVPVVPRCEAYREGCMSGFSSDRECKVEMGDNWSFSDGCCCKGGETCKDTDGGIVKEVKGEVCDATGCHEDYCGTGTLEEMYCDDNGRSNTEMIKCEYGCAPDKGSCAAKPTDTCDNVWCPDYEHCVNGKCVPHEDPYCKNIRCPDGERCVYGKCLPEEGCRDSDGGKNYEVKGEACVENSCMDDYCSARMLQEQYCDEVGLVQTEFIDCPNGCSQDMGSCADKPADPCSNVQCPEDHVCKEGKCFPLNPECENVWCPDYEVCYRGKCMPPDDPCNGMECNANQLCENGQCVQKQCPAGFECSPDFTTTMACKEGKGDSWQFMGDTECCCEMINTCIDTDGGVDYSTKGTTCTTGMGSCAVDRCDGSALLEQKCGALPYIIETKYYQCPNGCENGACKAGSSGGGATEGTLMIDTIEAYFGVKAGGLVTNIADADIKMYFKKYNPTYWGLNVGKSNKDTRIHPPYGIQYSGTLKEANCAEVMKVAKGKGDWVGNVAGEVCFRTEEGILGKLGPFNYTTNRKSPQVEVPFEVWYPVTY